MIDLTTIKLLVYDFDGVMTDNTAFVSENGIEMVRVNRSDGLAVQQLARQGFKQLILSTEANPVVTTRAQKLNIDDHPRLFAYFFYAQLFLYENHFLLSNSVPTSRDSSNRVFPFI